MQHEDVWRELGKPIAADLLQHAHLLRLAYAGRDGYPRVIPTGFIWNGTHIVTCTAERAPKVAALAARPNVAVTIDIEPQPVRALLIRGVANVEIVDGVPDEFLAANRKVGGPEEWRTFEVQSRDIYDRMARISIEPRWAKLLDFETTIPIAVEAIVRRKHPELLRS